MGESNIQMHCNGYTKYQHTEDEMMKKRWIVSTDTPKILKNEIDQKLLHLCLFGDEIYVQYGYKSKKPWGKDID